MCAGIVVLGSLFALPAASRAEIGPPIIKAPGQNSLQAGANSATVKVWGSAPAGTVSVEVFDLVAGSLGNAATDANGGWSRNAFLSDGSHTVYAVGTDSTGATSLESSTVTFTVDGFAPGGSLTTPHDDNHAYGPGDTITFAGTATDDRGLLTVRMRYWQLNSIVLEKLADCSCNGATSAMWSDEPASLSPGFYVVTATAIDKAGNQTEIGRRSFTTGLASVPMLAPPTPDIPGAPTIPAPTPSAPTPGSLLPGAAQPVPFRGHGTPGTTIEAWETKAGLGPLGSVQSNSQGVWRLNAVLPTGAYAVEFRAIDQDGNVSPWTNLLKFNVDADRPVVSILTGDNSVFLPLQTVSLQGSTVDNRGVSRVMVDYWLGDTLVAHDRARCLGCPHANITWTDTPSLPQAGYYLALVTGYDKAGNRSFVQQVRFIKFI
jgi:hypothetical protein